MVDKAYGTDVRASQAFPAEYSSARLKARIHVCPMDLGPFVLLRGKMSLLSLPTTLKDKIYPVTESGCWLWIGTTTTNGYGLSYFSNTRALAHRIVFEFIKLVHIPPGMQLDHLCRVRCCVNPDHLEIVTPRENWLRGTAPTVMNLQKTHCPKNHPLIEGNLRPSRTGRRRCLICHRESTRKALAKFYAKKRNVMSSLT